MNASFEEPVIFEVVRSQVGMAIAWSVELTGCCFPTHDVRVFLNVDSYESTNVAGRSERGTVYLIRRGTFFLRKNEKYGDCFIFLM